MIHNGATPRIEVDPETYDVTADGELLVCEPANVLPMAQRYFMFRMREPCSPRAPYVLLLPKPVRRGSANGAGSVDTNEAPPVSQRGLFAKRVLRAELPVRQPAKV